MLDLEGVYNELVPFNYEAHPGREWSRFYLEDGGVLTLTHEFLNLSPDERTNIIGLLNYKLNTRPSTDPYELDDLLVEGTEARAYRLGEDYVVKAVPYRRYFDINDVLENRLIYMSIFRDIVLDEFPEWVDVVPNYALLMDTEENGFIVMPRISEGITMRDLDLYVKGRRLRDNKLYAVIQSEFPGFDEHNLIDLDYQSWLLDQEMNNLYLNHPELRKLPDYREVNLLVTKKPVGTIGYPYKIWFIDQ